MLQPKCNLKKSSSIKMHKTKVSQLPDRYYLGAQAAPVAPALQVAQKPLIKNQQQPDQGHHRVEQVKSFRFR